MSYSDDTYYSDDTDEELAALRPRLRAQLAAQPGPAQRATRVELSEQGLLNALDPRRVTEEDFHRMLGEYAESQ